MLREAANESARIFSPTAGHRATEQRRDLARIPELVLPPLSLAGSPLEKLAPSARPPTYQESLESLPFCLQSQDGRYGKQSVRRAPQQ